MTTSLARRILLSALVLSGLAACGPRMPDTVAITGTVTYRERMMIPAESVIRIQLQDVALQDVAALQISETSFSAGGAPPYAFELEYFPAQILPQGRYALRATITHEDRLIFTSDTHIPAFQDGPVDIVVKRVRMPRPKPQFEE